MDNLSLCPFMPTEARFFVEESVHRERVINIVSILLFDAGITQARMTTEVETYVVAHGEKTSHAD